MCFSITLVVVQWVTIYLCPMTLYALATDGLKSHDSQSLVFWIEFMTWNICRSSKLRANIISTSWLMKKLKTQEVLKNKVPHPNRKMDKGHEQTIHRRHTCGQ